VFANTANRGGEPKETNNASFRIHRAKGKLKIAI
jgi:hypothetical protein